MHRFYYVLDSIARTIWRLKEQIFINVRKRVVIFLYIWDLSVDLFSELNVKSAILYGSVDFTQ